MNKKQRCLLKRFVALVAALLISFSLPVSALAVSDTEADMPSKADFLSHSGSWFVWRVSTDVLGSYYELIGDPIISTSSGYTLPTARSYSTNAFDIAVDTSDSFTAVYGCAFPSPIYSATGPWSSLPSFPVYASAISGAPYGVRVYTPDPSSLHQSVYGFLTSAFSVSDKSALYTYSESSSSSSSSLDVATFYSPLYSYPFAYREFSSSLNSGFKLQGGDNNFLAMPSRDNFYHIKLTSSRLLVGYSSFNKLPPTFSIPSSQLGIVFAKPPSSSYLITDSKDFNCTVSAVFSLLVPVGMLPDVKLGDWLSDSPEDLQKALTNEFGVDSNTLKDSKQNFDSWQNSNTIDTDVANTSLDVINALMQNVGQFVAVVSLLCFGAVVLRVLIRKAVEG